MNNLKISKEVINPTKNNTTVTHKPIAYKTAIRVRRLKNKHHVTILNIKSFINYPI